MNTPLKQIITSVLLLLSILSFSQESRFIELTVSDTIILKSIGYTYQIEIGEQYEFFGIKIPKKGDTDDTLTTSVTEVTNMIKKGNFLYSLSNENDYAISNKQAQPTILVEVTSEDELKSLVNLLKQQPGITGKIKEVKYESPSKYLSQIYKKLYDTAAAQATLMATISGNVVGRLLSISEAKSDADGFSEIYNQILKMMPNGMFSQSNILDKKELIKMTFKFELK